MSNKSILQSNNEALSANNLDLQSLIDQANALPDAGGVELPELSNEGAASDLLSGKQLIDGDGNVVKGIMINNGNLYVTIADFIETNAIEPDDPHGALIYNIPEGYHEGEGIVTISKGDKSLPTISVNSSGLITAVATTTSGYVTAGTKSSTHQLAFQPAKTITPNTASQIAVSGGYYTGGNIIVAAVPTQTKSITPKAASQNITPDSGKFLSKVTVAGDANLVAGNIKSGVSIFGVSGTLVEGSGGNEGGSAGADEVFEKILNRGFTTASHSTAISIDSYAFATCLKLTSVSFPAVKNIAPYAFYNCAKLSEANFPAVTRISGYAFAGCRGLIAINLPIVTIISTYAFQSCSSLALVNLPSITTIGNGVFVSCGSLTTASFPTVTRIGSSAFNRCCNLTSLYLTGSSLCTLSNSNAFASTPIGGYSTSAGTYGSIYVPASLLTSYQTATNWTYFSSRFVAYDGGTNMITFTIENKECQAEEGMTWAEWIESEYSTGSCYLENGKVMYQSGDHLKDADNRISQEANFIISHNKIYIT